MTANVTKRDGFFANLFDAYKQAVILLVMVIVYNIIPAGIAFLGMWLAEGLNYMQFLSTVLDIIQDPVGTITGGGVHYGYFIAFAAVLIAIVNFGAAFLYTASRNDRIAQPLGFFKAILAAWGILFQFALIIAAFVGLYYGLSYFGIIILDWILFVVAAVIGGLSFLAMIFRVVDYLIEM